MRPAEFSNEQIIEAGLAIQGSGRKVTGSAIRLVLGGGNLSRLKRVWDEFAASQKEAPALLIAELPPDAAQKITAVSTSVANLLKSWAGEMYGAAKHEASENISKIKQEQHHHSEQMELELNEASRTIDDLENQLETAKLEVQTLRDELRRQELEVARLDEQVKHVTLITQQLEEYKQKTARLTGEVEVLTTQNTQMMALLKSSLPNEQSGLSEQT